MFTGIIQHVGAVVGANPTPPGRRLRIDLGPLAEGLRPGDSVSVNGVCLTAGEIGSGQSSFDVVQETLGRTNMGKVVVGTTVNLERALRLGDTLDGHIVQGHVDAMARLGRVDRSGGRWELHFACERLLAAQMVPKGSIAIDGVSLTLVDVGSEGFSVALVPTTLVETTLSGIGPGQEVNIELDILGKYVRKHLDCRGAPGGEGSALTIEKLREAGF